MNSMVNAITIDVEDYYQVEAFSSTVRRNQWDDFPSRVLRNSEKMLKLFDKFKVKGTFFVLGCVAEKNKGIVEEIHAEGHEVACHGYSHKMILRQSKEEFRNETIKAKSLLEEIINEPIKGYRAATYSITRKNLWALEELMNIGFEYDSSIFPIKNDRYGISNFSRMPCIIGTGEKSIKEFPISTARVLGVNFPISGGGYFRLFPYGLTKKGLLSVNKENIPFVFYLHPWEIDPGQPIIKGVSKSTRFRHYVNLDKTEAKLERLLSDFSFDRIDRVLGKLTISTVDISAI